MQNQLVFKGKALTPIILNNQPYLGVLQIGVALNYAKPELVNKVYNNHADEFTPDMSFLTTIDTPGGKQQVRVFSLRGCHLLAMFSKTPVAKEFRKWVLDLIEQHATPAPVDMKALGGAVKRCAAAAIREEAEKAFSDMVYTEKFKTLVREAIREELEIDPSQWARQDWYITAHHAIDEIYRQYTGLKNRAKQLAEILEEN